MSQVREIVSYEELLTFAGNFMSQYGSPPRQFEEIVDSLKAHVNSGESWETVQQEFTRFARQYASSIMKDWAASIDLATLHKSPVQTKDFNPASQPQSR
jgi:hypothetical protein